MTAGYPALLGVFGALLGMVLGSFAGVVRSRGWRGALHGRSRCDGCGGELHWYELLPLVSYAVQRGRCRTCGAAIGREALLVELVCAVFGASLGVGWATIVAH